MTVAGVTRVCNNLQILFASIPQFSDLSFLREKMPNRCVAAGCSNVPDPSKSIGLHKFPEDNDSEKKRRRLWIAFVQTKRAKWSPTDTSRLCSQHFKPDDFQSHFITIPGTAFVSRAVLKRDAVPTIHSHKAEPSNVDHDIADSRSNREHRSVSKIVQICTFYVSVFTSYCLYCHIFVSQICVFILNRL